MNRWVFGRSVAATMLVLGVHATSAQAADQAVVSVSREEELVTIQHVSGGPMRVQVLVDEGQIRVRAFGGSARFTSGARCSVVADQEAPTLECGAASGGAFAPNSPAVAATLSSGSDEYISPFPGAVKAGGGNDTITASGAVEGGAGNDAITAVRVRQGDIRGGAGRDRIVAGFEDIASAYATIDGGTGNDTITTTAGVPRTLTGGPGDDRIEVFAIVRLTLNGGGGTDSVSLGPVGSSDGAPLKVSLDDRKNDGRAGGGTGNVGSDIERLIGTAGPDTLIGNRLRNELLGMNGRDSLYGAGGPDLLVGGPSGPPSTAKLGLPPFLEGYGQHFDEFFLGDNSQDDDRLDGGSGGDVIRGGAGSDTVTYAARTTSVRLTLDGRADDGEPREHDNLGRDLEGVLGGRGDDIIVAGASGNLLRGGPGADRIAGGGGDDNIDGGPGDDQLQGGGGSDLLLGGTGRDVFDGSSGIDAVTYAGTPLAIRASLDGVGNDGRAGEFDNARSGIEALIGGDGSDLLRGNATPNLLIGGLGADQLDGSPATASASAEEPAAPSPSPGTPSAQLIPARGDRLLAGYGDDRVLGSPFADIIDVDLGNDQVDARGGDDQVLVNGEGTDRLLGGDGLDLVDFSQTNSPLALSLDSAANDGPRGAPTSTLLAFEHVTGGQRDDLIVGGDDPNVLRGGLGDDEIFGGGGVDQLFGGFGADMLDARDGVDGEEVDCGDDGDRFGVDPGDKPTGCETPL